MAFVFRNNIFEFICVTGPDIVCQRGLGHACHIAIIRINPIKFPSFVLIVNKFFAPFVGGIFFENIKNST